MTACLVSTEKTRRKHIEDALLSFSQSLLCACLGIRRKVASGISQNSSFFEHNENTSEFEAKMATWLPM